MGSNVITSYTPPPTKNPPPAVPSIFQNIPILKRISTNPKVQMITKTISQNLPNQKKKNQPITYVYENTTNSTTDSNDDIILSSSMIMKEEDALELQRIRNQYNAHPILRLWNYGKFIIHFLISSFKEYGIVCVTFFVAFYVYLYSRKKFVCLFWDD